MNNSKVSTAHLQRWAYIYVRQSTAAQVEHHRESTTASTSSSDEPVTWGGRRIGSKW